MCCRGREILSNPGENNWQCLFISETTFRVEQIATQTQFMCGLRQGAITTGHVKQFFPNRVFVSRFQLVSEWRGREW